MAKTVVLYNPLSGNCTAQTVEQMFSDAIRYDVTKISDYAALFNDLTEEDAVVLCGGDGTLNRFANEIYEMDVKCDILYLPVGTGNDFAFDVIGSKHSEAPIPVKKYLKHLPTVTVNGIRYRFLNGVGFGIDGYCCEVGDELRKKNAKSINYAMIAVKGLLFHYKPTDAKITVDGTEYRYKKVWLAPAMFGRFYGGGMMPTPGQTRDCDTVSTLVFYGSGKLKSLMIFPSIFSGKHVTHKDVVSVLTGREISVEFDSPRAVQIDGETISGVTSYKAVAPQRTE